MNDAIRNDPKKFRNYQIQILVRQQIVGLLLQYPELEEDDQLRADMVEGETDAFDLLQALEAKRKEALAMASGIQREIIDDAKARMARFERREEAMRKLMLDIMQIARIQKTELPGATLSVRAGTPKVIITDEARLPDIYWRIKREPNKTKLKEDLSQNWVIAGAELSNAEPTLSIRTK